MNCATSVVTTTTRCVAISTVCVRVVLHRIETCQEDNIHQQGEPAGSSTSVEQVYIRSI